PLFEPNAHAAHPGHAVSPEARYGTAKGPEFEHRDFVLFQDVLERAVETQLGLRLVMPLPAPEEGFDFGNIRASFDVFDGLILDGEDCRDEEGLSVGPREFELDRRFLARFVGFL